jgi:hypothetical protein
VPTALRARWSSLLKLYGTSQQTSQQTRPSSLKLYGLIESNLRTHSFSGLDRVPGMLYRKRASERVGGNAPKDLAGRNHTIFMYASIIYLSIYVYVCMYIYIYTCDSNPPATNTCVTRTTCALP